MAEADCNVKFAVSLADGMRVEAVYYGSGTLCVSSQAGCALGCPFCASGRQGLMRNLSPAEMLLQVEIAWEKGLRPVRITVSGVGEPLHNFSSLLAFMDLCTERGLPLSLTTTGSPLQRLSAILGLPHNGLMVSVHAGTAETHGRLIPRGPDFEQLWGVLDGGLPGLSRRRRRKVGINYLLIEGVNDSEEDLSRLALRMKKHPELTLHLLTLNPVPQSPFSSPDEKRISAVQAWLSDLGLHVRRANAWRRLQEGGCGTLTARGGFA